MEQQEPQALGERALVAQASLTGRRVEQPLAEITSLAQTAGAEVVDAVSQKLSRPHPGPYSQPALLRHCAIPRQILRRYAAPLSSTT